MCDLVAPGLTARVARKQIEAQDICTFELVAADGGALPEFSAGSHIDVYLPQGFTRQYSLCNDPLERHRYVIGVLKDPGGRGGSRAMHDEVHEGDVLQVSYPRNHFRLAWDARRHLLLAGGIGITPILCMAHRLASAGEEFEMHYCSRSLTRTAFHERIVQSQFASSVVFHFDDADESQRLDLSALVAACDDGTHLYVCGPKGFMDWVLGSARAWGWPEHRLHYEFFACDAVKSSSDAPFDVRLARAGMTVNVPAGLTVVQALAKAGVSIPISCEQGVCGTCQVSVLEGEPEHRDMCLTEAERAANDRFLPCCSRAKTPLLVLDL